MKEREKGKIFFSYMFGENRRPRRSSQREKNENDEYLYFRGNVHKERPIPPHTIPAGEIHFQV